MKIRAEVPIHDGGMIEIDDLCLALPNFHCPFSNFAKVYTKGTQDLRNFEALWQHSAASKAVFINFLQKVQLRIMTLLATYARTFTGNYKKENNIHALT